MFNPVTGGEGAAGSSEGCYVLLGHSKEGWWQQRETGINNFFLIRM